MPVCVQNIVNYDCLLMAAGLQIAEELSNNILIMMYDIMAYRITIFSDSIYFDITIALI